jgi:hypothetical protein
MHTRTSFLLGALALSALAACGNDAPKPADTTAKSAAPAAAATPAPAATAKPDVAAKPTLEDTQNKVMGYTIKLPKGATTSMSDKNGGSYGAGTMIIMVGPTGVELKTPDDVLRGVNTTGGTIEKKTVGNAVVAIVTKPSSPVTVYAGPKGKKIASTCMAEPSQKDLAIEICASLTATK